MVVPSQPGPPWIPTRTWTDKTALRITILPDLLAAGELVGQGAGNRPDDRTHDVELLV